MGHGSRARHFPWVWLGALLLVGGAVFAARTLQLPFGEQARSALPTPVEAAQPTTGTQRPGLATAQPRPTPGSTPVPVAAQTAARARTTAAPTHEPVAAGNPTHVANAAGQSTPAGTPTAAAARVAATATAHGPATTTPTGAPSTSTATAEGAAKPTVAATAANPVGGANAATASTSSAGAAGAVMLTFDAGADRGYAEDILDLLADEHVVASFGVTGQWAKANPDLVRRMAADGHLVFDHTLDHRSFTGVSDQRGGLSPASRRAELEDADAILAPLVGHTTRPWYRLPYGDDDAHVAADVQAAGYTRKIGWTVDSLGWRGASSSDIVARCLQLAAPGAVFALHVGRASQDAIALPQVIRGLRDKGYAFHRVDQG